MKQLQESFKVAARITYLAAQLLDRGLDTEAIIATVDAPELESEIRTVVDSLLYERQPTDKSYLACWLRQVPAEFRLDVATLGLRPS